MKMRKVLSFLVGVITLSSCALVQDGNFNKDNSGSMSVYLDMSGMVSEMRGRDAK